MKALYFIALFTVCLTKIYAQNAQLGTAWKKKLIDEKWSKWANWEQVAKSKNSK